MEFNTKPNFKKAKEEANMILLSSNFVYSFPFEISKLVSEKSKVVCTTYKTAKERCPDLNCENLGSDDAELVEYHGKRLILINKGKYDKRVRFSVGHEFGHHILQHNLSEKEKTILDIYEVEANIFSAQLLMPEEIINEFIRRGKTVTTRNIMSWFNVSEEAASKRMDYFIKYDYNKRTVEEQDVYNQLLLKFKSYIDSIAPVRYYDEDEEELQNNRNSWFSDRKNYY